MRKRLGVALLAISLTGAVPSAPAVGATIASSEGIPELVGTTVITGTGMVSAALEVPRDLQVTADDIDIALSGGDYAYAGLANREWQPKGELPFVMFGLAVGDLLPYRSLSAQPHGLLSAGVYDLYLLTDGEATFSIEAPELGDGRLELSATEPVDAEVHELDNECVGPAECSTLVYGGMRRTLHPPAHAAIYAYSTIGTSEFEVSPGLIALDACLAPNIGPTGPTPAPQPRYGCPSPIDDPTDPESLSSRGVVGDVTLTGGSLNSYRANSSADGEVYAGFFGRATGVLREGKVRAFTFWIQGEALPG